jgi:hypothetical protein
VIAMPIQYDIKHAFKDEGASVSEIAKRVDVCGRMKDSGAILTACIGKTASGAVDETGEVRFGPNPALNLLSIYYSLDSDAHFAVYDAATAHELTWDLAEAMTPQ